MTLFFLIAAFLIIPFIEVWILIQVADSTGLFNTIGLLIFLSVIGAWLVRREGLSVFRKAQNELIQGQLPERQILDGLLILFGGVLMLTPGFFTDFIGFCLLFPLSRILFRTVLIKRLNSRISNQNSYIRNGRVQWVYSKRQEETIEILETPHREEDD
ncbi:MAG TPA: FxsA family protein [Acidimicrobiales bacterium]|nr:FxsA family protein [Acidimicrobiales bacterium]